MNTAIAAVKAALAENDLDSIRGGTDRLRTALSEAGSAVYQQTAGQQAAGPQPGYAGSGETGGTKEGEDVVDADFEVHDEK